MTMPTTTGGRAVEAVLGAGFRSLDAFTDEQGYFHEEFADITGNRIGLLMAVPYGALIMATPRGPWVRDIERRFPYWPEQPYVITVEALEKLLTTPGVLG